MASPVRVVTPDDIPWLHAVCAAAYQRGHYEPDAAEIWVRAMIASPAYLVLRGRKAWMAATVSGLPYAPKYLVGRIVAVAGKASKELFAMADIVAAWFRRMGAKAIYLGTITGVDLGPIARRLGAKPNSPSYVVEFN